MPDEKTLSCPVCGAANPPTAAACASCGVALTSKDSVGQVDALLKDLLAPEEGPKAPTEESLDLDAEIVDDLLDSLLIEEKSDLRIECPLCGHEVAADATRCDHCGSRFEEVRLATAPVKAAVPPSEPARAAAPRKGREKSIHEDIPVSAGLTESDGKKAFPLAGHTMDLVVLGTVAAMVAVFLLFRMYSWSGLSQDATPFLAFAGVAAAGIAAGFVVFRLSTSAIAQGDRLVRSGRYQDALAHFDRAIRMGHRPSNAWTSRGVAMKRLGKLEEALRCQQVATRLDPENEIAWCNEGDVYFRMGDFAKALEAYDKAIKLRPKYAIAWNNKGAALARMNRFEEARTCHDKAVRLQPKYIAAWLNRGEVLARLGEREEAQKCLERARALGA